MQDALALTEATYYILLALHSPRHGYGIMQKVEAMSAGRVRLAAGTLYGALTSMAERGWIRPLPAEEGERRKQYCLTPRGREALSREIERLRELLQNGEKIMGGMQDD